MEQNTLDDQLKNYFQQHKKEIKDANFTKSVMQKLPRAERSNYIIYLFLFIGVFLMIVLNGYGNVMITLGDITHSIPNLKMPLAQSLSIFGGVVITVISISLIGIEKDDSILQL